MTLTTPLLALSGLLLTFVATMLLFPPYMRLLRYLGIVKTPRSEGPSSHSAKRGTPTMAGLLVVVVVTLSTVLLYFFVPDDARGEYVVQTLTPLLALVSVGALGALDDYLDAIFGRGIRGRHKLIWQASVAKSMMKIEACRWLSGRITTHSMTMPRILTSRIARIIATGDGSPIRE